MARGHRRETAYSSPVTWGGLSELGALFAPGMRHEQERRRSEELSREDDGTASDPPNMIDLDSGMVTLTRVEDPEA